MLGILEIQGSFQQAARTLGRRRVSTLVSVGARLGRYEIHSQIGAGGMGEVYPAQDTKLDREVALKILPADLAANQDRMRRFVQEAKAAAALNHPNIAHIYEIGESEGVNFIAMEFVDGQKRPAKTSYSSLYVAYIYAGLNDKDKTFEWLNKAVEERGLLSTIKVDPPFENLRGDPRFKDLSKRLNLPE